MAKSHFNNVTIKGMSITLGENKRVIDDDPFYYNNDDAFLARLKKTIGFGTRYVAAQDTTTCDLCEDAARRLLCETKISVNDIDAIIFVTQTPDYFMPGNAHVIHEKLQFPKETLALDVELGCSGFVYGLWLSYMMVSSGLNRILLLTGDTLSKSANPKDRTEYPLFCDAGSATIIEKTEKNAPSYFILKSDGTGVKHMLQPAGAYRLPSSEETRKEIIDKDGNTRSQENIYMNGFEIFNFTLTEQPPLLKDILEYSGKMKDEIDYFLFHQGNKYIVDTISKSAQLPKEKVPVIFSDFGNQNSAAIPGTICATLFDKINSSTQVIIQGFGIGLSWGACQLSLDDITILNPKIYSGEKND